MAKRTETAGAAGIRRCEYIQTTRHGVAKVIEIHDGGRRLIVTGYTRREHTVTVSRWKRLLR